MKQPAIDVKKLGKAYRLGESGSRTPQLRTALKELVSAPLQSLKKSFSPLPSRELFWAVKDLNFQAQQGEVIGIVGRNGAGKSTILKLLSRITPPSAGEIRLRGRVASLLEVGTGFHPEFTGRENIYINGSLLGMRTREIDENFADIVAFADVDKFLDTPVKRYSSGMRVRLAFAIAAHLEPEILLVDEVLAVGDLAFQRKCIGKMQEVSQSQGRTVLFVSHNMASIKDLCQRVIYLKGGVIEVDDSAEIAVAAYLEDSLKDFKRGSLDEFRLYPNPQRARFQAINLRSKTRDDHGLPCISSGDGLTLELDIAVEEPVDDVKITLDLEKDSGERAAVIFSGDEKRSFDLRPPRAKISCHIEEIPLTCGIYKAGIGMNVAPGKARSLDYLKAYPLFTLSDVPQTRGGFPNRKWGLLHLKRVQWRELL